MADITTTQQGFDRDSILLMIGGACGGVCVTALVQVPGIRDTLGRIVGGPEMKDAACKALAALATGFAGALNQRASGAASSPA